MIKKFDFSQKSKATDTYLCCALNQTLNQTVNWNVRCLQEQHREAKEANNNQREIVEIVEQYLFRSEASSI